MKPNEYQAQKITSVPASFAQGKRRVCYAVTTGSGKTILVVNAASKVLSIARLSGADRLQVSKGLNVPVVAVRVFLSAGFLAASMKANREVMSR
jgi:hypothetical protein